MFRDDPLFSDIIAAMDQYGMYLAAIVFGSRDQFAESIVVRPLCIYKCMDDVDVLTCGLRDDLAAKPQIYIPENIGAKLKNWCSTVDRQMIMKDLKLRTQRQRVCDRQFARGGRPMNYYQFHNVLLLMTTE